MLQWRTTSDRTIFFDVLPLFFYFQKFQRMSNNESSETTTRLLMHCQWRCIRMVNLFWNICILTYLGHDLTLIWPEARFWIYVSRSKSSTYMFRTGSTRRTRWCHFHVSRIKKVIDEKSFPWKAIIFHLMTSGIKTVEHRSNLIENVTRAWRELSNVFFYSS